MLKGIISLGGIHKGYPIFWANFWPTYPYPIFTHSKDYFRSAVSDFREPTYLPKNRISFLDAPKAQKKDVKNMAKNCCKIFIIKNFRKIQPIISAKIVVKTLVNKLVEIFCWILQLEFEKPKQHNHRGHPERISDFWGHFLTYLPTHIRFSPILKTVLDR